MRELMSARTWTGQFSIIDGDVREEGPGIASFPGRPNEREQTTLYILAEPAPPCDESLVEQTIQAIGQLFRQQEVSLTGSLLRAILGAHESLYRWNHQQGNRNAWGAAGISAAITRGTNVYLAQCAPALAYALDGEGFRRITPGPAAGGPLGVAEALHPSFTRHNLGPDARLLLACSELGRLASDERIASILAMPPEDALPELYVIAKSQDQFWLLLLAGTSGTVGEEGPREARAGAVAPPSRRNPFGRTGR